MQSLKRILADIKSGENLDLYITIVIALPLAALSVLGITPQSWIAPLTLTVLALLALSLLVNRHKMEIVRKENSRAMDAIRNQLEPGSKLRFMEDFPPSFESDLINAQELWIVGINLHGTMVDEYSLFEQKAKRKDVMRILLMDPDGSAINLSVTRARRHIPPERARETIRETLDNLCSLLKISPESIEIRTLDYPVPFGAFVINPNSSGGSIYWENYGYYMPKFQRPRSFIPYDNREWYDFYKEQIESLWDRGTRWKCQV